MVQLTLGLVAAALAGSAFAHPGHSVEAEALERREFLESKPRDVASCAAQLKARGHADRSIQRRAAIAQDLMAKRGLKPRDAGTVLRTNHRSRLTGITTDTDPSVLFASNSNCVLQPETTEGPYFVSGELIRKDLREGQAGIDAYVYIQIVDTSTCDPLPNIYVDAWHCNSTGVYGGVTASGNGNTNDKSNVDSTAFRGLQATDADGVVEFTSIVPGHYTGRTNHIHILTHHPSGTRVFPNGTLGTNSLLSTHVGQIFFDQSLLQAVERVSPYSTNRQTITTNAQDGILLQEAATSDPMLEYVLLGDSIEDGILGWITVGIDTKRRYNVVNAAYVDKNGGHMTGKSLGGPGGGGFPAEADADAPLEA